ncbi:transforming growth factor beta regulator 1-like [Liolophura sinensis]|uniref:transforming growth factor beta regulator 1-like n=1 Tax=Liolophura sinensis TaxID=3198878 RepID=UPI0031585EE6
MASGVPYEIRGSLLQQSYPPSSSLLSPHGRITGGSVASLGLSQLSSGSSHPRLYGVHKSHDHYQKKYRRLKKLIKQFVFINAGVCDEVVRLEEHIAKAKEERRFLLRKVLQYQSQTEAASLTCGARPIPPSPQPGSLKSPGASSTMSLDSSTDNIPAEKTPASKRKKKPADKALDKAEKNRVAKELMESLKAKPKKSKSQGGGKKVVPPIPLDTLGRPVFPLCLGNLTVHSLGEIVTDRPGFHSQDYIYPIGFCSTQVYANIKEPDQSCLYTCKVSEDDLGDPQFEISPEDSSDEVMTGHTPDECHILLLQAINQSIGRTVVDLNQRKGGEFFGFGHPVIQNLIQSCPGAKKCSGYKWVRYEVSKTATLSSTPQTDPTLHVEALREKISTVTNSAQNKQEPMSVQQGSATEASTSLRSLLTSGPGKAPKKM